MDKVIAFLLPWEFSPFISSVCLILGVLYFKGTRALGESVGWHRHISFWLGLVLTYGVLQTHFDYYAQHMFWIHRLQHLVLHHIGPFLIVLSYPKKSLLCGWGVLVKGLPKPKFEIPTAILRKCMSGITFLFQNPVVAPLLFVGLIFFWLDPRVHFYAMISYKLYALMNWSMWFDGLLFWYWILDDRPLDEGNPTGFGIRILILWCVMIPQILLGSHLAFSTSELYSVYQVCGRAWPLNPIVDQQYAGLITWIPASMMSVLAGLLVLRLWLNSMENNYVNVL